MPFQQDHPVRCCRNTIAELLGTAKRRSIWTSNVWHWIIFDEYFQYIDRQSSLISLQSQSGCRLQVVNAIVGRPFWFFARTEWELIAEDQSAEERIRAEVHCRWTAKRAAVNVNSGMVGIAVPASFCYLPGRFQRLTYRSEDRPPLRQTLSSDSKVESPANPRETQISLQKLSVDQKAN